MRSASRRQSALRANPAPPRVPRGPNTQETSGEKSPLRTYQDLLSNPYEEELFEHYATSQPVFVSLDDGRVKPFGEPALYKEISSSPDGRSLLVARGTDMEALTKQYSVATPVTGSAPRAAWRALLRRA